MRYITADHIFPVSSEPVPNGVIIMDEQGYIHDLVPQASVPESSSLEKYKGIICPGFINTHCHLELSHMKGHIAEKTGMTGFIGEFLRKRPDFHEAEIQEAIRMGEEEMIRNGIVAVGDISNTSDTFRQKSKGRLLYHTFIEVFQMDPSKAEETMREGLRLRKELLLADDRQQASLSPHAPYTMSAELLLLIAEEAKKQGSILSMHNQESQGENELFLYGTGPMQEAFSRMGIKKELLRKTGERSLKSVLPLLKGASKILLVHNTVSTAEDIRFAKSFCEEGTLYWCTCPNANLYIENALPDYSVFLKENASMTIGTDSLASNQTLSVFDELRTIQRHTELPLQMLLTWATKNGAEFLGLDALGTIQKGKRPGLNLLKDLNGFRITNDTSLEKIA